MRLSFFFRSLAIIFASVCLVSLWASFTHAQQQAASQSQTIGQVVWVKGEVKAIVGNQSRALQRRSPVYAKDTIVTDKTSTGQLVFSDNSLVSLSADTVMRIDEYQFGKNVPKGQSKFVASLVKGGFRTITGLIPKDNADNYQVNTPVATIGVRGTSYAIRFSNGQLYAKYISGRPCIHNKKGEVCLSASEIYASVGSAGAMPVILAHDPGVFNSIPDLTPATFTPTSPFSGVTNGPGGTITPKNNSFCIQ